MKYLKFLLLATRPKTLPASIVPVLIGSSLAYSEGFFNLPVFILIILCAVFIQIISNYFNEIYDFYRGADSKGRVGPPRAVSLGLLPVKVLRNVTIILVFITLGMGIFIVSYAGYPILIVGLVSLFFAYAYTGGPYPLAYLGLGDIFVFIFFGLAATMGTYFVFAHKITILSFIYAIQPGFLSTNILGVNNLRDVESDRIVGKNTIVVRFGKTMAQYLYIGLIIVTYLVSLYLYLSSGLLLKLLPFLTIPYAVILCIQLRNVSGPELNNILAGTGKLLFIFGVLVSLGNII
jgi:1,4-dihydroxy-2-naphthoate polyprenyltransferase